MNTIFLIISLLTYSYTTYNVFKADVPRKVFRPITWSWLWLRSLQQKPHLNIYHNTELQLQDNYYKIFKFTYFYSSLTFILFYYILNVNVTTNFIIVTFGSICNANDTSLEWLSTYTVHSVYREFNNRIINYIFIILQLYKNIPYLSQIVYSCYYCFYILTATIVDVIALCINSPAALFTLLKETEVELSICKAVTSLIVFTVGINLKKSLVCGNKTSKLSWIKKN